MWGPELKATKDDPSGHRTALRMCFCVDEVVVSLCRTFHTHGYGA